jgi:hypothetical protein
MRQVKDGALAWFLMDAVGAGARPGPGRTDDPAPVFRRWPVGPLRLHPAGYGDRVVVGRVRRYQHAQQRGPVRAPRAFRPRACAAPAGHPLGGLDPTFLVLLLLVQLVGSVVIPDLAH